MCTDSVSLKKEHREGKERKKVGEKPKIKLETFKDEFHYRKGSQCQACVEAEVRNSSEVARK